MNVAKEAIIQGQALRVDASGHGVPVENAYVHLRPRRSVRGRGATNESGHLRFFAGNGEWTRWTRGPRADVVDHSVTAQVGWVAEVAVAF